MRKKEVWEKRRRIVMRVYLRMKFLDGSLRWNEEDMSQNWSREVQNVRKDPRMSF